MNEITRALVALASVVTDALAAVVAGSSLLLEFTGVVVVVGAGGAQSAAVHIRRAELVPHVIVFTMHVLVVAAVVAAAFMLAFAAVSQSAAVHIWRAEPVPHVIVFTTQVLAVEAATGAVKVSEVITLLYSVYIPVLN